MIPMYDETELEEPFEEHTDRMERLGNERDELHDWLRRHPEVAA